MQLAPRYPFKTKKKKFTCVKVSEGDERLCVLSILCVLCV
jgi:hypothetical protein